MRFFRPFLFGLAATSATVNANALRQHQQRALIDVCANVDANLKLLGIVFGRIDLCLCVSAIPHLLDTNLVLKAAVLLLGKNAVTAAVTALINGASDHKQCHYPDHAVPHCSSNPCDFTCKDGFTPSPSSKPTDCVCKSPNTVCNGVCGYFPHCSSQHAKRDATWRDATCPHGWSACGVWGSRLDYECVDVRKDLWSCGGCDLPLLSTDPTGVDCTAIAGVHDVSCVLGHCAVQRCKDGFNVSSDKTSCVPTTRISPHNPNAIFVNNGEGSFKA